MSTLTASLAAPPTSAERSVREVALRLGIPNVDHVVEQMRQEYVLTDWQLSALDSFQWKSLGAPIGLAVAVHQIIQQQQEQRQQQKIYVFPSDIQMTQDSKILHDFDPHNNIIEPAIDRTHKNSMDEEEKEETQVPVSSCTVVDAEVQDTPIMEESKDDDKNQNSEEEAKDDASSAEEDCVTEPVIDENTGAFVVQNYPDETKHVAPEATTKATIAETVSTEDTPPLVALDTESSIVENVPEELENIEPDATIQADITESVSMDDISPQEDERVNVHSTTLDVDRNIPPTIDNDIDISKANMSRGIDVEMTTSSSIENDSDDNEAAMSPESSGIVKNPDDKSLEKITNPDVLVTSQEVNPSLGKTPSNSSLDANEDMDTVPTSSKEINNSKPSLSPTLSAPLPHDECDDSFHASQSKELLLKPSFDLSEDTLSEDPLEEFASTNNNNDNDDDGKEKDNDNPDSSLEPYALQKQPNQHHDSFGTEEEEEEESLEEDLEDDIIITGQDLLVDLGGDAPQEEEEEEEAAMPLLDKQQQSDPFEFSFGQFRTASLVVDPHSVTITEFRSVGSEDDGQGDVSFSTADTTTTEPFVMHKRTVSSLESLYYVDGDESTVVASNVSPERRNRPKRRRSLEDSSSASISTFNHDVSSFDVEWDDFLKILGAIPNTKTQRTILSQLLIMTNGRTKAARYKLAKQVSHIILKSSMDEETNNSQELKLILQLFAKLHRQERKALGKKIFGQISKLYVGGDNNDDDDDVKKKKKDETNIPAENEAIVEEAPPEEEEELLEQI